MKNLRSIGLLLILVALLPCAATAQRRRPNPAKAPAVTPTPTPPPAQPEPTFDNILAADSYTIYGEIRGVGQLLRSPSFTDVVDPIVRVAGPPQEFKTLMKWLNSESEALMTSRMMVATWPTRPKLPKVLFAIEFSSAEEARKFEPRLKTFLPKFIPTPTPESSPQTGASPSAARNSAKPGQSVEKSAAKPAETPPPYIVKQAGTLIYISDVGFDPKVLRPTGSRLLAEDPNFRRVHDRFSTEAVLVYVNTAAMQREEQERRRQYEDEERKRVEAQAVNPPKAEPDEDETASDEMIAQPPPPNSEGPEPELVPQVQPDTAQTEPKVTTGDSQPSNPAADAAGQAFGSITRLLFGGATVWPEAVGVAAAFEPDSYSLRVLLVSEPGERANPVPFMPQVVSGPPLIPESPSIFPADTEFFVALSLDYPQIYEGMLKTLNAEAMRAGMAPAKVDSTSPFAAYEKQSGIKIKDDLIPLLGNEIAITLPVQSLDLGPSKPATGSDSESSGDRDSAEKPAAPETPSPVIAISIKDRDAARLLIPKVIESIGLKGASQLAQTEKRGDTEITSYAGAFSYAFVGNFLLLSPNPKAVRHVVDSYLNHETLGSDSHFRNYTRWQPRQLLGQLYVSPALMDSYSSFAKTLDSSITDQLGDLLSRLSPTSEPVTYALSNEGLGPLHELRIPKNLAMLMIAGIFGASSQAPPPGMNEAMAKDALRTVASAEATYQATEGNGSYGSSDQLIAKGLVSKDLFERYGYRVEVTGSGKTYEARATPLEYGKSGKLSFFVDETGVIRGGDKGGGPATVADGPIN
jgi:hypothetical protein